MAVRGPPALGPLAAATGVSEPAHNHRQGPAPRMLRIW
jgi:hypothetical protein